MCALKRLSSLIDRSNLFRTAIENIVKSIIFLPDIKILQYFKDNNELSYLEALSFTEFFLSHRCNFHNFFIAVIILE